MHFYVRAFLRLQKEDNLIGQLHKEDWILKKTSFATAPIFRALRVWLKRTNKYEVKIASNRVLSKSTKHFSSVLNNAAVERSILDTSSPLI